MEIVGKGSIVNLEKPKEKARCRKWRLKVNTVDGLKTKRVSGTYTQAQQALEVYIAELAAIPEKESTFGEYAEKWINYRDRCGDFAKRTINKNVSSLRALNWHLKDVALTDITPDLIKSTYIKLRDGESPSGKPLSGTYLNTAHIALNQILTEAITDGYISNNPCEKVKAPRVDTSEKVALTDEQILSLESSLDDRGITGHTTAIKLAIFAGLRRSEICALRWADYDGSFVSVLNGAEEDGALKGTKSKASCRDIPLDATMQDQLDKWYKIQAQNFARLGKSRNETTRIITDEKCDVMVPHNLGRWWSRNRDDFGLPCVTIHELRHSYLTMLVHSGANIKVAQTLAGHAKLDVLLNIYTHRNRDEERLAVDEMMAKLKHRGTSEGTNGAFAKTGLPV